jgi:hypothetical protein
MSRPVSRPRVWCAWQATEIRPRPAMEDDVKHWNWPVWLLGGATVACGGLGGSDESVSLTSAGVNVSVTLPKGGKLEPSPDDPGVRWAGLSFVASFSLNRRLSIEKAEPLALDQHGTYDAKTPVVVAGQRYVCWVRAKKQLDAERIQRACDALSAASPKAPSEAAKSAAAPPIELEDKKVQPIGCSIKLPKGAKTLQEDKYTATYSLPLPGGLYELNVSVNGASTSSLEQAKKTSTMMGGSIESAKQLPNGFFEVITAPEGTIQTVSTFAPKFGAKCSGPTSYLPKLTEICESLSGGTPEKSGVAAKSAPEKSAKAPAAAKAAASAKTAAPTKKK